MVRLISLLFLLLSSQVYAGDALGLDDVDIIKPVPVYTNHQNFDAEFDDYYAIKNISVKKIENAGDSLVGGEFVVPLKNDIASKAFDLGDFISKGEKLIAFGTKVWEIVKKGEPNLDLKLAKPISVMPNVQGENIAFSELESWSAPKVNSYFIEMKNLYGVALVSFRYNVAFQSNGTLKGKGRYITGLQVSATSVAVQWGVSFDAVSSLDSISNRGTSDDPVAGATMSLTYKTGTVFSKVVQTQNFHMTGSGEFMTY
jgi:hypothetical protein